MLFIHSLPIHPCSASAAEGTGSGGGATVPAVPAPLGEEASPPAALVAAAAAGEGEAGADPELIGDLYEWKRRQQLYPSFR